MVEYHDRYFINQGDGAVIKKDIVYRVQEATGLSLAKSEEAVEAVLDEMKNALTSGEGVNIIRFGGFRVADKNPRPGRNPRTGEAVIIPARKVVTFRASVILKEAVNHQPPRSENDATPKPPLDI